MYQITFENQPRHNSPDYEYDSIKLSRKQYEKLPILSKKELFDEHCEYARVEFREPTRHSTRYFPALRISHPDWTLDSKNRSNSYLNPDIRWFIVCLDVTDNTWLAFEYYDIADIEDAYCSTVGVSFPRHGKLYRPGPDVMELVRKYFP